MAGVGAALILVARSLSVVAFGTVIFGASLSPPLAVDSKESFRSVLMAACALTSFSLFLSSLNALLAFGSVVSSVIADLMPLY